MLILLKNAPARFLLITPFLLNLQNVWWRIVVNAVSGSVSMPPIQDNN